MKELNCFPKLPVLRLVFPRCFCSPGWTGVDCAEDVNECDSAPCLNGAGCQESDVPGEFSCTCPPFFSGPFCSLPHDPCGPVHNPCLNNSTCLTRSDGTASCRCPAGEWIHTSTTSYSVFLSLSLSLSFPLVLSPSSHFLSVNTSFCFWGLLQVEDKRGTNGKKKRQIKKKIFGQFAGESRKEGMNPISVQHACVSPLWACL